MGIAWTKKWNLTDDGKVLTGTEIGTLQDDIDAGTAGALPVPGTTDGLKIPRVLSDHSGYELIAQVPMSAGGTGADLSVGTAGYAVVSQGTAGNMTFAPLYHTLDVTFLADSATQTVYCVSPVTGVLSTGYVCNFVANRGTAYTVKLGSAGTTMATATALSTGVAGATTTLVLGTVAVTAGAAISVARGDMGTTGASMVSLVIIKTP